MLGRRSRHLLQHLTCIEKSINSQGKKVKGKEPWGMNDAETIYTMSRETYKYIRTVAILCPPFFVLNSSRK